MHSTILELDFGELSWTKRMMDSQGRIGISSNPDGGVRFPCDGNACIQGGKMFQKTDWTLEEEADALGSDAQQVSRLKDSPIYSFCSQPGSGGAR